MESQKEGNWQMSVDYKLLLYKYMATAIATCAINRTLCPCCLNHQELFSYEEREALHDVTEQDNALDNIVLISAELTTKQ